MPIPVILDTDLGSDIDDTWALAQLLRSPELEPRLVLTTAGDTRYRARLVAKLLQVSGRCEVPVGVGHYGGPMPASARAQEDWVRGYEIGQFPGTVHPDGLAAAVDLVRASPNPVTIIAIGPATNLARLVEAAPDLPGRCRLVGMFGSFDAGYDGGPPSSETNVRLDPAALRAVFAAPWRDILLTPLDTCGAVSLRGDLYRAVWQAMDDPLARAVIENYCLFAPRVPWIHCDFFALRSTTLFDCVAVYLAHSEDLVEVEEIPFRVTDDGFTLRDPAGPCRARVALRWRDRDAFERFLAARLLGRA